MWRRSSRRCTVMPSAPPSSASTAAATGSGSAARRACRTVATWSMFTPKRIGWVVMAAERVRKWKQPAGRSPAGCYRFGQFSAVAVDAGQELLVALELAAERLIHDDDEHDVHRLIDHVAENPQPAAEQEPGQERDSQRRGDDDFAGPAHPVAVVGE